MDASKAQRRKRKSTAFTLIELLTVVVIIGILAGLITAAVIKARTFVKERKIRAEIDLMSQAMEAYKNRFNAYPPDMTGLDYNDRQALIMRHLATAFPKYKATTQSDLYQQFKYDVGQATGGRLNVDNMDAGSALIFWLGGIPNLDSNPIRMTGFSANAASPFQSAAVTPNRIPPMFSEYQPERVAFINGQLRYYPDEPLASEVGQAPYVYFRNRGNTYNTTAQRWNFVPPDGTASEVVTPVPIWDGTNVPGDWASYDSFQILCAGLDGKFGRTTNGDLPYYPKGGNYGPEHLDNMANFCGSTFDGEMD